MNEIAASMNDGFGYVRRVYAESGKLLQVAERVIGEKGWQGKHGRPCYAGTSWDINLPDWWLPNSVYRMFENSGKPALLPLISCVFFNRSSADYPFERFDFPVVTAAVLKFPDAATLNAEWKKGQNNFFKWALWGADWWGSAGFDADGKPFTDTGEEKYWEGDFEEKFTQATFFMRPLAEIESEAKLQKLVLEPWLALVAKESM